MILKINSCIRILYFSCLPFFPHLWKYVSSRCLSSMERKRIFSTLVLIPISFIRCFKIYWIPSTWPNAKYFLYRKKTEKFSRKSCLITFWRMSEVIRKRMEAWRWEKTAHSRDCKCSRMAKSTGFSMKHSRTNPISVEYVIHLRSYHCFVFKCLWGFLFCCGFIF